MEREADINVLINKNAKSISVLDLLDSFENNNWRLDFQERITFLPLNDTDYDWRFLPKGEKDELYSIIRKKIEAKEVVGISLIYTPKNIGVIALIDAGLEEMSFNLNLNRKNIDCIDIVDFTLYIESIVPVLMNAGLSIESIECTDA